MLKNNRPNGIRILLLCGIFATMVAMLTGCGGRKTVVTQDDSADYHSARSLPPLKKPSVPAVIQSPVHSSAPTPARISSGTNDTAGDQPVSVDNASSDYSDAVAPVAVAPVAGTPVENIEQDLTRSLIDARVIEPKVNTARLQIDVDFEQAWDYVSNNLVRSDITVHNRNPKAGRFAVGCASMDESEGSTKGGGWSIFRRKVERTEHCTLQLTSNESITTASLLSRSGNEVTAASARAVFARLLNN